MKSAPVVLLGGHLSPAQAIAEYLVRNYPDVPVYFIGRRHAFSRRSNQSTEEQSMKHLASVFLIDPPRNLWPWDWPSLFRSFCTVLLLLLRIKPQTVVCFGSYVALPGILASVILGVRLIVHEQTRSLSRMNKLAARFAAAVCVNDQTVSVGEFIGKRRVTGFPLRPSLFDPVLSAGFSIPVGLPLLVVMGGTTGAVTLNSLVFPIIERLISSCVVVHLTGEISASAAEELRTGLPKELRERYIHAPYCSSETMRWLYRQVTLAVTRTGANTIYELFSFHIPAVCIPLPWSQGNEQQHLAAWFVKNEQGIVLDQRTTTAEALYLAIDSLLQTHVTKSAPDSTIALSGTKQLVEVIFEV